jgi:hypothetical protein
MMRAGASLCDMITPIWWWCGAGIVGEAGSVIRG